jgi:hypothetical protein
VGQDVGCGGKQPGKGDTPVRLRPLGAPAGFDKFRTSKEL